MDGGGYVMNDSIDGKLHAIAEEFTDGFSPKLFEFFLFLVPGLI